MLKNCLFISIIISGNVYAGKLDPDKCWGKSERNWPKNKETLANLTETLENLVGEDLSKADLSNLLAEVGKAKVIVKCVGDVKEDARKFYLGKIETIEKEIKKLKDVKPVEKNKIVALLSREIEDSTFFTKTYSGSSATYIQKHVKSIYTSWQRAKISWTSKKVDTNELRNKTSKSKYELGKKHRETQETLIKNLDEIRKSVHNKWDNEEDDLKRDRYAKRLNEIDKLKGVIDDYYTPSYVGLLLLEKKDPNIIIDSLIDILIARGRWH